MTREAVNMLGLCARARRLVTGEKAVVNAIRQGSAHLALIDGGIAKNGEKAVTNACLSHSVPLIKTDPGQLGPAIGQPTRMAVAITDQGFAERIATLELRVES